MRKMEQGARALIALRDMILTGALEGGQRLRELALVEELQISRTPIRFALGRLADEGLVENTGGGFSVREFTVREVGDAIRLRGVIEGMAARIAAERATPSELMPLARACIDALDDLLAADTLDHEHLETYLDINRRFHLLLSELSESFVLQRALNHVSALPFAAPNAFVTAQGEAGDLRETLVGARQRYRSVLQAIENHDGDGAEAIAREDAELSLAAMRKALQSRGRLDLAPGLKLLRDDEEG